jgi:hypothetical protein
MQQRIQITVLRSLSRLLGKLPSEISEWGQAMLFEASETNSGGEFVTWIFGVLTTTFRLLVHYALDIGRATRPLAATCAAFYFGCLASFVFFRLLVEILSAKIPLLWGSVWMSAGRCVGLAILCFAVAIGIWYRRRSARYLAMAVAAAQLLATISTTGLKELAYLDFMKLCTDLAIIVMMSQSAVRIAFRTPALDSNQDSAHSEL